MIRKVRLRFIRAALAALSVAMILVAVIINGANWYFVQQELLDTVRVISSNGGSYPRETAGRGHGLGRRAYRESSYENRYFSVRLNRAGQYEALNMDNIASVTQSEAIELAQRAVESGSESGIIDNYMFYVESSDGRAIISFLDCEARLGALKSLALISALACAAGVLMALAAVALLSGRAIQPLIENAQRQKQFITDAGHELKTPLSVISANMDVLGLDLGEENEWVEGTKRQVGNMRRLVNDLIALSKMDEDTPALAAGRFDLSGAVSETASAFAPMAELAGKQLDLQVQEGLFVRGDENAVRHLVSGFCDNAVKYAPEGDRIEIALCARGRRALIYTRNALSEPLDEDALSRLFDRFYRADPARTRDGAPGGHGIGLAIARAVAQRHGGRAGARLIASQRIEFFCLLPLAR